LYTTCAVKIGLLNKSIISQTGFDDMNVIKLLLHCCRRISNSVIQYVSGKTRLKFNGNYFIHILIPYFIRAMIIALMMEAASTFETFVNFCQTSWRNNPGDSHLHTRRRENLKSYAETWSKGSRFRPLPCEAQQMFRVHLSSVDPRNQVPAPG
jgi:hypothetical protein